MHTLLRISPATLSMIGCILAIVVSIVVVTRGHLRGQRSRPVIEVQVTTEDTRAREHMLQEVVDLWTMWLDDGGIRARDKRRALLPRYAGYVTDAVRYYQAHDTDIGGRLPTHADAHLVVAVMLAKESSLRYKAQGTRGELGLGQMHGVAIRPWTRAEVRASPPLQVLLHARWLAAQIPDCYPHGIPDDQWKLDDWVQPLSLYAGGSQRALRKNGTCKRYRKMADRVDMVHMYRQRMDTDAWTVLSSPQEDHP